MLFGDRKHVTNFELVLGRRPRKYDLLLAEN
jgi:hypothetical protein